MGDGPRRVVPLKGTGEAAERVADAGCGWKLPEKGAIFADDAPRVVRDGVEAAFYERGEAIEIRCGWWGESEGSRVFVAVGRTVVGADTEILCEHLERCADKIGEVRSVLEGE